MTSKTEQVENQLNAVAVPAKSKWLIMTGIICPPLILWLLGKRVYAVASLGLIIISLILAQIYSSLNNWPFPIWTFPLHVLVYLATAYHVYFALLENAEQFNSKRIVISFWFIMLIMFGAYQLLVSSSFSRYGIASVSMNPTLIHGDYVISKQLTKESHGESNSIAGLGYGDIVIFEHPEGDEIQVKRIVALAGDRVTFSGESLTINDEKIKRETINTNNSGTPFLWLKTELYSENNHGKKYLISVSGETVQVSGEVVVPPGHVFVMGDNRNQSIDSRFWGVLPVDNILEKPLLIWWSVKPGVQPLIRWNRIGRWVE